MIPQLAPYEIKAPTAEEMQRKVATAEVLIKCLSVKELHELTHAEQEAYHEALKTATASLAPMYLIYPKKGDPAREDLKNEVIHLARQSAFVDVLDILKGPTFTDYATAEEAIEWLRSWLTERTSEPIPSPCTE